ncbi:DUF2959 family protein [Salinivibrio sp. ML290]|uniref:DUF2959 family protein n=1 Tax=Salinivibrio sp. ML290 TaxID=1909468 RepID=UPI000D52D60B|nr:DUF2959 family protein [Salinivibrio sp. ML290]
MIKELPVRVIFMLATCLTLLTGCQSAYYSAMEQVGIHKRDIMVDRVEDAANAQQAAQSQFKDARQALSQLTEFEGGELQAAYEAVDSQYQQSHDAVTRVRERIDALESVSDALFDEWEEELDLYTNRRLQRDSEQRLRQTREEYERLRDAMRRAEQTMTPVLNTLQDNRLYLKHNLNARAIGALQGELDALSGEIDRAVADMQRAIQASNRFIQTLN